ncbi:hypothetical protein GF325_13465 [Candidatus Bathyarchaeota archaeon]|nr:hypothetical protein [Candidatus Bathyarchaeota archaeon]
MIHSLFIIDHGIAIFTHHFKNETAIDAQLLSGFLSAIGSFAQETFQTGLQTIHIRNGEKMNFYVEQDHGLIFCAISNEKDNNKLLLKILKQISEAFIDEKGEVFTSPSRSDIAKYKDFSDTLEKIMRGRATPRNAGMIILGLVLGLIVLFVSFFIFLIIIDILTLPENYIIMVAIYFLTGFMLLSSWIAGFFAGNQMIGLYAGIVFFAIFVVGIFLFLKVLLLYIVMFGPFTFLACVTGGYWGGAKGDMKKLYPIQDRSNPRKEAPTVSNQ